MTLGLLLILEELYTFFVLKPTLTSSSKRNIEEKFDFPQILICPEPSVDTEAMTSLGYSSIDFYVNGLEESDDGRLGWAGNNSESIEEVSEKISVIKSIDDCPIEKESWSWSKTEWENLRFKLKKVPYPHHICCELVPPKFAESSHIVGIQLAFSFTNKSFNSYRIFMADNLTESFFTFHKNKMLGDKIRSKPDINGFLTYKIQIKEEIHLEDDPNYHCINYNTAGEYHKCLEKVIMNDLLNHLNCTPPWMTDDKDLWCRGRLPLKSESFYLEYATVIDEILLSDADTGQCLTPCKSKKYLSTEIGVKEFGDLDGVTMYFDKEVEITRTELQIGSKTLITRFGGIIGVSKNLLWIVIFGFSSVGFIFSKISNRTNPETDGDWKQEL